MPDISKYKNIAKAMIDAESERDKDFASYEKMYHSDWDLPPEMAATQWIRKDVSTDPHDSIEAAVRVLSVLDPAVTYQPLSSSQDSKDLANKVEKVLKWQLKRANMRRPAPVQEDFVRSALLYDIIIANVVDLEYQVQQKQLAGLSANREKAMRRYGRFMVNTYNPREVKVRYSGLMPEAVLLHVKKTGQEIMDEWGNAANELDKDADYVLHDYVDYAHRCVWAEGSQSQDTVILDAENKLGFLPWVVSTGGSTLENNPKHRYNPVLYSVLQSDQWELQNTIRSLYVSEVISHAAAARIIIQALDKNRPPVPDYGDPTKPLIIGVGEQATPVPSPQMDRALAEIDDRIAASIDKSTVSRVIQNGDIPAGAAFATLNLATQTAVGALKPFKKLAERALAEMFEIMLLWVDETAQPISAYGTGKEDNGLEYIVDRGIIQPDAIYIDVELTADVPTDRMSRINAASIAVGTLNMPKEMALQDVGVEDPEAAFEQYYFEKLLDAMLQLEIERQRQMMMLEVQLKGQEMQQAMLAAQQQGQGGPPQGAPGSQEGLPPENGGMEPGGIPGAEGQGFNPAMGGQSAQMMMPEATREGQTGMTQGGAEVAYA